MTPESDWTEASGMTREEWDRQAAQIRYWNTFEDLETPGPMAGGGLVMLKYNPPPELDGLSAEEAEAALARWHEQLDAWVAARQKRPAVPAP